MVNQWTSIPLTSQVLSQRIQVGRVKRDIIPPSLVQSDFHGIIQVNMLAQAQIPDGCFLMHCLTIQLQSLQWVVTATAKCVWRASDQGKLIRHKNLNKLEFKILHFFQAL